jgi:phosphoribosyl-ATP pyrophosphohydrolase/phosphoribosyl-AMP cyclohydrolase
MLKYDKNGLIPVIIQHYKTGQVLMLAYANQESLKLTFESGDVWFYSRSRNELWHKGATSGSLLKWKSITKDCDSDTILIQVDPAGPVCHTGNMSCFFQEMNAVEVEQD